MNWIEHIAEAPIGVFGWVRADGTPSSCPVTPYVVNDEVVITSTLAYTSKAAAVQRDPRVALLAGGVLVSGRAQVLVDETPHWFDKNIRREEIIKFPPTKSILSIPGHRCFFSWYVGRVVIHFHPERWEFVEAGDTATATQLVDGRLRIVPIAVDIGNTPNVTKLNDGPVSILYHEEHKMMTDLRQQTLRGSVRDGEFVEQRRSGSLAPKKNGSCSQILELRKLARSAKNNREALKALSSK